MSAQRAILNTSKLRALAVGGSISWGSFALAGDSRDNENYEGNWTLEKPRSFYAFDSTRQFSRYCNSKLETFSSFLEPTKTSMESVSGVDKEPAIGETTPTKTIIQYDFIIVGHGNAGQSAIRTLRERCPRAKIAVIDPFRSLPSHQKSNAPVDHFRETATGFDPNRKTIRLLSDPTTQLQYRYGVLVATGSRGAPPPLELFEEASLSRVLELRTTELLGNTKRPVMASETVRKVITDSASKGAKIVILGSGWEALDLVCTAEKDGRKKPSIVFGNPGPVWNILPQYLSSELRKKLEKRGVDIQDRSVVRYVADISHGKTRKIELHTAKSYDLLETRRTVLDLLVGKTFKHLMSQADLLAFFRSLS